MSSRGDIVALSFPYSDSTLGVPRSESSMGVC
jgi:hypothetical protein